LPFQQRHHHFYAAYVSACPAQLGVPHEEQDQVSHLHGGSLHSAISQWSHDEAMHTKVEVDTTQDDSQE
jgi:hypothetical protein